MSREGFCFGNWNLNAVHIAYSDPCQLAWQVSRDFKARGQDADHLGPGRLMLQVKKISRLIRDIQTQPPLGAWKSHSPVSKLTGVLLFVCATNLAAGPITLERTDANLSLSNGLWSVEFTKDRGWATTRIRDLSSGKEIRGEFFRALIRPKTLRGRDHGMIPEGLSWPSNASEVSMRVTSVKPGQVVLVRKWKLKQGVVTETMTFHSEARKFDCRAVLAATAPVAEFLAEARCDDLEFAGRAMFLPEEGRSVGSRNTSNLPYIEATDPQTMIGFGMQPGKGVPRIGRYAFGAPERGEDRHPEVRDRNLARISVISPLLEHRETPAEFAIAYTGYMSVEGKRPIEVNLPTLELRRAWPKKLIARPTEGNTLEVIIRNNTQAECKARLAVKLVRGLTDEQTLESRELTLKPGDTSLKFDIDTKSIRYGVEVATTLTDLESSREQTRSEYFAVWPGYYRVSPLMAIHNPGGGRGMLAKSIPSARHGYVGVTEIYCWPLDPLFDMTPEADWFVPGTNSQGAYLVAWSKKYLKDLIDTAHANGLGMVSWAQASLPLHSALAHPEVLLYSREGHWGGDFYRIYHNAEDLTRGVFKGTVETADPGFNFGDPKVAKMWGEEMGRSCEMFGWDGVRFDGPAPRFAGAVPLDPLKWKESGGPRFYDFKGQPIGLPPKQADEQSLANMRAWLAGARKANPDFELGMNMGHGFRQMSDADPGNSWTPDSWPKSLKFVGDHEAMMLIEGALTIHDRRWSHWDTWTKKLMGSYRIAQKLGCVCTVGHLRWLPSIADRTRTYIAFASGYRLAYVGSEEQSYYTHERFKAAEFAIRFGEFLFGKDHEPLPNDQNQIKVEGHERLHWKLFVRRRALPGGRSEWLVHIVNLPKNNSISYNHPPPPARIGTTVRFSLDGKRAVSAHMLLPDPPRAKKLDFHTQGQSAIVKLDPIEAFTSVVLQLE